jgi:hypothetical protein
MTMKDWLGTVLPTPATIRAANLTARKREAMQERVAATDPRLWNCERRVVGGEVRYYDTTDQYAIVSREGKVLWFQVTPKGDFRIYP